ncbi:MAG: GNAT family N-acetyltransferase [Hyphomonadaceae bacterium]|nr:GNAT family N-acetyltransferase [Hyphomonadaceae bacterium]
MEQFTIRRAVASDADAVCRLVAAAAAEEGAANLFTTEAYRRDAVGAHAPVEVWLVEAERGRPCAQAITGSGYDLARATLTMVLLHLFVAPHHRRDGLARLLITHIAARARDLGVRELTITTGVENAVARRFFEAIGAQEDRLARYLIGADGLSWLAAEAG